MVYKFKKKVYQQTLLNLKSLGSRSINNLFSYIKCHYDSDIVKGQHYNDNEEGQAIEE
jgi:hypothetical protein